MVPENFINWQTCKQIFENWQKVGIVAADTSRAAAIDQLRVWAERTKSKFYLQM